MIDATGILAFLALVAVGRIWHGPFVAPQERPPGRPTFRRRARVVEPAPSGGGRPIPADVEDELGLLDGEGGDAR